MAHSKSTIRSEPARKGWNRSHRSRKTKAWHVDSFILNTWVQVQAGGRRIARKVWVAVMLDAGTGAVAGFILRTCALTARDLCDLLSLSLEHTRDGRWSVSCCPETMITDQGLDYTSTCFRAALQEYGIVHDPLDCAVPQLEPKTEQWFMALDTECLCALPGYRSRGYSPDEDRVPVSEFLTLQQLEREITRWAHDSRRI